MGPLQILGGTSVRECGFKLAKRLCLDRTSALLFSFGFVSCFGVSFLENTSGRLLMNIDNFICDSIGFYIRCINCCVDFCTDEGSVKKAKYS